MLGIKGIGNQMSATRLIELTKNQIAIVDSKDFNFLTKFKWHAHSSGANKNKFYATRTSKKIKMEHMILRHQMNSKTVVDHINNNSLDNRRSNLRIVSLAANTALAKKRSCYSGVRKAYHKYQSYIKINKKFIHLGMFASKEEAAFAYNLAAILIYGESYPMNWREYNED